MVVGYLTVKVRHDRETPVLHEVIIDELVFEQGNSVFVLPSKKVPKIHFDNLKADPGADPLAFSDGAAHAAAAFFASVPTQFISAYTEDSMYITRWRISMIKPSSPSHL